MTVDALEHGWLIVQGFPMYHRESLMAGTDAPAIVHVHGFGISGTYLEPTAAALIEAHVNGTPLHTDVGPLSVSELLDIPA